MKHQLRKRQEAGFSLVEMLVVIAVIGIIAAIAIPSLGAINDKANAAKAKRNAQTVAALYNSSRGVGAVYASQQTSLIIDELVEGKTGPELAGSSFQMSSMSEEEKTAVMAYVSYDAASDQMNYDPTGGQEVVEGPWWGDWTPASVQELIDELASEGIYDAVGPTDTPWGFDTEAIAAEDAALLNAAFPDYNFTPRLHTNPPTPEQPEPDSWWTLDMHPNSDT